MFSFVLICICIEKCYSFICQVHICTHMHTHVRTHAPTHTQASSLHAIQYSHTKTHTVCNKLSASWQLYRHPSPHLTERSPHCLFQHCSNAVFCSSPLTWQWQYRNIHMNISFILGKDTEKYFPFYFSLSHIPVYLAFLFFSKNSTLLSPLFNIFVSLYLFACLLTILSGNHLRKIQK